jgi:hypothetical protein
VSQSSPRNGLLFVALTLAVMSLGIAVFALLRGDRAPDYTDAQRTDARAEICAAFATAVAANARVALFDGGQYLLARLDPAAPAELATSVRDFGRQLMDIGAAATAGVPNDDPAQAGRLRAAEAASTAIDGMCR